MKQNVHEMVDYLLDYTHFDLLLISVLMLIFALVLLRIRRQLTIEHQLREETNRQLLNALQRITHLEDIIPNEDVCRQQPYGNEICPDELRNRLQSPCGTGHAPDKYRHVASLEQQGMSVAQIAEVLNLSLAEVKQLVALARIAPRQ